MTIDKAKLRALAEAETNEPKWYHAESFGLSHVKDADTRAFISACGPATILSLLDEIERLSKNPVAQAVDAIATAAARHLASEAKGCLEKGLLETIEQVKVENESLRKDAARLTWLDESQEVDSVGPTLCCGKHRPTLREAIDAAMAMEARHDC